MREGRGRAGRALVVGATSLVGDWLLPRLVAGGFEVRAISRRPHPADAAPSGGEGPGSVSWEVGDISGEWPGPEGRWPLAVHLAPLWLLPPLVPRLADKGLRRVVAFGSMSRFTRASSRSRSERQMAARLADAERDLAQAAEAHDIGWTVLRPTLIHGGGRDRNVTVIASVVRRLGFFPLVGAGGGLRQPVHADDLAQACLAALASPVTIRRSYNVGGGEILTFREMVERIAVGAGRRPRLVRVPPAILRGLVRVAALWPGLTHLTPEMGARMEEDLVCDITEARRDFGYAPRPFRFAEDSDPC